MIEMNKVFLCGNLTRDPELRYIPSGSAVADLRLAVNRRLFDRNTGEKRDETVFIDVTAWEKLAEFCKNYLSKGRGIFVEGRLRQENWEDKQTGAQRSKISVVAERIQFADPKPQGGEASGGSVGEGGGESNHYAPTARPANNPAPAPPANHFDAPPAAATGNTEDDLPF